MFAETKPKVPCTLLVTKLKDVHDVVSSQGTGMQIQAVQEIPEVTDKFGLGVQVKQGKG